MSEVRVALRTLHHTAGFSITAILTLGLGIGLVTAVFTVANTDCWWQSSTA